MLTSFRAKPPGATLRLRPVLVLATLTACSGGDAALSDDAPEWLAAPAEPVRLELAFDTARTRAKEITPAGGTVTATGADGTRYSLRIPEGALIVSEVISLTPAARVDGLPFETSDFATVHIEPSGLLLLKPGTLTLRTRDEIDPGEQVAFGYSGTGDDAHLVPILSVGRGRIEIPVLHFSGYGYGRAAPDDPGRLALQKATSLGARLSARLAAELGRARERALRGIDENLITLVGDPMIEYYDAVLRPLMEIARDDERMARCALDRYLVWERQLQLIAGDADAGDASSSSPHVIELQKRRAEGSAAYKEIYKRSLERLIANALERCRTEHDFSVISTVLGLEQQAELIGFSAEENFNVRLRAIQDCLTFDIEFRSVIELKTPTGGTYHHVLANVEYQSFSPPQTAPLEYVAFRASGSPMRDLFGGVPGTTPAGDIFGQAETTLSAAGTEPGVAQVTSVMWDMNPRSVGATNCEGEDIRELRDFAEHFRVFIAPGVPTEIVRHTYVREGEQIDIAAVMEGWARAMGDNASAAAMDTLRVGGPMTTRETTWADTWSWLHQDLAVDITGLVTEGGLYRIRLDSVPGARGVWRADLKAEPPQLSGFSVTGSSYLILRHAPR